MASSSKPNHVRSISLPGSSHPSIQTVEEELNKLKTMEMSADTICNGLVGLGEVYKCLDDLLNLPQTLQVLSQFQNKKLADDLLVKSVELLDICSLTNETVSHLKEYLRDILSSLRRRKGDSSLEASITRYTSFRKKINKDAKRSIAALKKMDDEAVSGVDQHVSSMIKLLREANAMSISIFQVVLQFLSMPILRPKQSKWLVVSRLVHKGRVECEYQQENMNNLETLEAQLEAIENELGSMFRCFIKSRSSLLNTVSC